MNSYLYIWFINDEIPVYVPVKKDRYTNTGQYLWYLWESLFLHTIELDTFQRICVMPAKEKCNRQTDKVIHYCWRHKNSPKHGSFIVANFINLLK